MLNLPSDRYTVYLIEDRYVFSTNDNRTYSVVFEEQPFFEQGEFAFAEHAYEVFLTLEKAPPAYPTDTKIGATLAAVIKEFIDNDPSRLVFFTCDTADGRHLARYKRFNTWFSENNTDYYKLEDKIDYPAINKLFYITLILRNDNPNSGQILVSFTNVTSRIRSQK